MCIENKDYLSRKNTRNELNKIISNKDCINGLYLKIVVFYILYSSRTICTVFVPCSQNNSVFDKIVTICNQHLYLIYSSFNLLSFCKTDSAYQKLFLSEQKRPNVIIKACTKCIIRKKLQKKIKEDLEISLRRLYKKCNQKI